MLIKSLHTELDEKEVELDDEDDPQLRRI